MKYTDLEQIATILRNDNEDHYGRRGEIEVKLDLTPSSLRELQDDCNRKAAYLIQTDLIKASKSNELTGSMSSLKLGQQQVTFKLNVVY